MLELGKSIERTIKPGAWRAMLTLAVSAFVMAGAAELMMRAPHALVVAAPKAETQSERVLLAIEGMHCDSCATGIKAMLKRTAGVITVDVSYERKEAVVEYDPGRTTREKLVQVIVNMGYKASVKS